MLNKIIALAIAAGFATASFAQGSAPAPSVAPAAKVAAPAAAAAEKKVEAPKAAEPAKAETKVAANEKHEKHGKKPVKTEAKSEPTAPAPAGK